MKKIYKILTTLTIIIAAILIVNEFVLFPIFPPYTISPLCIRPSLNGLVNRAEIILTGIAGSSTAVPIPTGAETHTEITISNVIKGSYGNNNVFVKQFGGCIKRLNMCWISSISEKFDEGGNYLLFISSPDQNNVYSGFSTCGGKYTISLDENGNEIVPCFAEDINNCIEMEIPCPKVQDGQATLIPSEGVTVPSQEPCTKKIVRLSELINQIQGFIGNYSDLSIEEFYVSPIEANAGDNLNFFVTIKNKGNSPAYIWELFVELKGNYTGNINSALMAELAPNKLRNYNSSFILQESGNISLSAKVFVLEGYLDPFSYNNEKNLSIEVGISNCSDLGGTCCAINVTLPGMGCEGGYFVDTIECGLPLEGCCVNGQCVR